MDTQADIRRILADIDPFPRLVHEGIERGCEHGRAYCDWRRRGIESGYQLERVIANDLTRSVVKSYLKEHGRFEVETDYEFEQFNVGNLGLRSQWRGYDLRIWRSKDERIPYPGSKRKQAFINGAYQLALMPPENVDSPNLVFIWNADSQHYFTDLFLVRPWYAPEKIFEDVGVRWVTQISHPASTMQSSSDPAVTKPGELPYQPLEEEEDTDSEKTGE